MLERLLLTLCRDPADVPSGRETSAGPGPVNGALDPLRRVFPELDDHVAGRRVLDFGCGHGRQAVACALAGAEEVVAVDINPRLLEAGRELAALHGVEDRVAFVPSLPEEKRDGLDLVLSLNSMEHVADPGEVLATMFAALRAGGRALISFSPPWLSPYGGHMHFFTPVPWVHVLFPESVVLRARSRYRDDGATRYEEVEGGLNRMTLRRFEELVDASGFEVVERADAAVRGVPAVNRIPGVREFLTVRVACTLEKPGAGVRPDPASTPQFSISGTIPSNEDEREEEPGAARGL